MNNQSEGKVMSDRARILEKVRKLLSLAARNPSREEASAAALKAAEIMERHKIDEAEIGPPARPESYGYLTVFEPGRRSRLVLAAYSALAEMFDCVGLVTSSKIDTLIGFDVAGTESDRASAIAVMRMVEAAAKADLRRLFAGFPKKYRDSFVWAMVSEVAERLKSQRDFIRSHSPASRALVRVESLERVVTFIRSDGVVKASFKAPAIDPLAARIGMVQGSRLELNRPVKEATA